MRSKEEFQARAKRRARQYVQVDAARFLLYGVGRLDIFKELHWITDHITLDEAIRMDDISRHHGFNPFPIQFEYREREHREPEERIEKVLEHYPDTLVGKYFAKSQSSGDFDNEAVALILPWHRELVVIHNCPSLTKFPPVDKLEFCDRPPLVSHWFQPLFGKLAKQYRAEMSDGESIMELEEAGEWGPRHWSSYPKPYFE